MNNNDEYGPHILISDPTSIERNKNLSLSLFSEEWDKHIDFTQFSPKQREILIKQRDEYIKKIKSLLINTLTSETSDSKEKRKKKRELTESNLPELLAQVSQMDLATKTQFNNKKEEIQKEIIDTLKSLLFPSNTVQDRYQEDFSTFEINSPDEIDILAQKYALYRFLLQEFDSNARSPFMQNLVKNDTQLERLLQSVKQKLEPVNHSSQRMDGTYYRAQVDQISVEQTQSTLPNAKSQLFEYISNIYDQIMATIQNSQEQDTTSNYTDRINAFQDLFSYQFRDHFDLNAQLRKHQ